MSINDPKSFIENLELAEPTYPIQSLAEVEIGKRSLEAGEEQEPQAFINNKSLVSFIANVNGQNRQDVLNSTLLAQLVATKAFPNEDQIMLWYEKYIEVLQNIGWVIQGSEFNPLDSSKALVEMENVVLDILGAAFGGSYLAILVKTLESVKKLSNTDNRIIAFEKNTHSMSKGNFQIGLATEENDAVLLNMGAFILHTTEKVNKILFFKFQKSKFDLKVKTFKGTLSSDVYAKFRIPILQKLEAHINNYVSEIEI